MELLFQKSDIIPDGARIFKLNDATWKGNSKDKQLNGEVWN